LLRDIWKKWLSLLGQYKGRTLPPDLSSPPTTRKSCQKQKDTFPVRAHPPCRGSPWLLPSWCAIFCGWESRLQARRPKNTVRGKSSTSCVVLLASGAVLGGGPW
jgi:hypothetical protein